MKGGGKREGKIYELSMIRYLLNYLISWGGGGGGGGGGKERGFYFYFLVLFVQWKKKINFFFSFSFLLESWIAMKTIIS